ncbi:hypothetical protein RCCGEPOP_22182 [Rhizobium sp. Pop5]|nr:hypothetical protein RCCGEPOP_22182 [Rhizobium sp. Pop5]
MIDIVKRISSEGGFNMRTTGYVIGLLMIVLGLIWIGQGSGYFPYPASSFMIAQTIWVLWGAILAAVGIAVVVIVSRLRRRG